LIDFLFWFAGLSQFKVEWVSQASAQQRAGRAGRTGPGHCYRLFSSAVFNDQFEKFASPEITRLPLEGTVLHLKSMGIEDVARFPFPTPPDAAGLQSAIKTLTMLSALTAPPASVLSMAQAKLLSGKSSDGISMGVVNDVDQAASIAIEVATSQKITQIGRSLAVLPVAPRFGKMLALGNQGGCLHFAVAVVASLCVEELFFSLDTDMTADENNIQEMEVDAGKADQDGALKKSKDKEAARRADAADKEARKARLTALRVAKQKFSSSHSDLLTNLRVIGTFDHVPMDERVAFCQQNCIILKSMLEVQELRSQLTRVIAQKFNSNLKPAALLPPSPAQERLLCQIVASGLVDHVARKWPRDLRVVLDDGTEFSGGGGAYQCNAVPGPVYLHPSTALFSVGNQPDLCVYVELVRTTKRTYIKGVTSIQPEWLPNLAPSECSDRLLDAPAPKYDMEQDRIKCWVDCTFGPNRWPLPRRLVDFPDSNSNVAISAETTTFQRLVGGSNNFRQRLFAQFLLEGQVCKGFAKFRSYLNTKPASLLSSYAASQKVTALLAALTKSKVDSLAKLKSKWFDFFLC
jgi:ATP-dependent RNA helicase DHX37/DHR1